MRQSNPCVTIGAAATILLFGICAFAQQSVDGVYQRARLLDESNQNLTEAIRLYNQVITQAKDQRSLAARAKYRIGVLYERLGRKADSQRAFKIVVSQFPDQTDLARRAQEKLIAAGANGRQADNAVVKQTGPSADGWYQATFTSLTEQDFVHPVVDQAGHRLYVITRNYYEPRNDAERKRVVRQGLRYVYEKSNLIVIDTEKNTIIKTIPLAVFISEIAFNPTNNKLYATAQLDGHIKVIDASTFVQTKISVPGQPTNVAVNATTNKIYVTSQGFAGNDKLFVIDGATHAIARPYDLDGVANGVVVNSATNRIYASAPPKTRVFDGTDNSVVADLTGINVIGADPPHNIIYARATGTGADDVQVLDGNTHSVIATLGFSSPAYAIGIVPNINRLYAVLHHKNQIAVVDTNTHTEIGRLLVAEAPVLLTVDPATGHAYVCHSTSPSMIGMLAVRGLEGEIAEEFSDAFDSVTLKSSWTLASGPGSYSLTETSGDLRVRVAKPSGSKPRFLMSRKFRGDYWTLETKTSYFTGASGGSRSLVFGVTLGAVPVADQFGKLSVRIPINAVYIFRVRDDWNGCCPGDIRLYVVENGKVVSFNALTPNRADAYVWRFKRNGRAITIERSDDGINFALAGSHTFGPQIEGAIQFLGIGYISHANDDAYVDFDYVRLRKSKPD